MNVIKKLAFRKWVYNVGIAAAALLVVYGIVTAEQAAAWGVVIGAISGIARANTKPADDDTEQDSNTDTEI